MNSRMAAAVGLAIGLTALADPALAWGDDCEHTAKRELGLDAASINELKLRARAGELQVRGNAAVTAIRVEGKACASSAELLEGIQLTQSRSGAVQAVDVQMPETSGSWWGGSSYARLDLVVTVPARMALDIEDSSGDLSVENVASVRVDDSSGGIEISSISGSVEIEDNSGEIEVSDIGGDVLIPRDNSGDIRVEGVKGSVRVERDGSGSIRLRDVGGDAFVGEDGSGEIEFERIGGSAIVEEDGSGSIRVVDVVGDFRVVRDGSGGISHRGVGGKVSIPERD